MGAFRVFFSVFLEFRAFWGFRAFTGLGLGFRGLRFRVWGQGLFGPVWFRFRVEG